MRRFVLHDTDGQIRPAYFFGMHLFGVVCLIGWIQYADPKYKDVLAEAGQNMNWWYATTEYTTRFSIAEPIQGNLLCADND